MFKLQTVIAGNSTDFSCVSSVDVTMGWVLKSIHILKKFRMVRKVKAKKSVSQSADRTSDLALAALFNPEIEDSWPKATKVLQITPPKPIFAHRRELQMQIP